jgi:ubiquinone/menaquinone biosynthesis C-methylase UbiE
LQREAVWRHLDPLIQPGGTLLDLGCGTGEDALHFMSAGMRVNAFDASSEMVRIARGRGVDATQLSIEEIGSLQGSFDGVISNFGALNCIEKLEGLRIPLAKLIRPGGHLAICVMGRFCFWEIVWYLSHAQPRKAFRRWAQNGVVSSLGMRVYYPSVRQIRRAFHPDFKLSGWHGIGISIPPSYVTGLSNRTLTRLGRLDERLAPLRALADHRLLVFRRE